jgi:hypothetical protein
VADLGAGGAGRAPCGRAAAETQGGGYQAGQAKRANREPAACYREEQVRQEQGRKSGTGPRHNKDEPGATGAKAQEAKDAGGGAPSAEARLTQAENTLETKENKAAQKKPGEEGGHTH